MPGQPDLSASAVRAAARNLPPARALRIGRGRREDSEGIINGGHNIYYDSSSGEIVMQFYMREVGRWVELLRVSAEEGAAMLGANVASASTLVYPSDGGTVFTITGSNPIDALFQGVEDGLQVVLVFEGSPTVRHSDSLVLSGAANVVVQADDVMSFVHMGMNVWREVARSARGRSGLKPLLNLNVAITVANRWNATGLTIPAGADLQISLRDENYSWNITRVNSGFLREVLDNGAPGASYDPSASATAGQVLELFGPEGTQEWHIGKASNYELLVGATATTADPTPLRVDQIV